MVKYSKVKLLPTTKHIVKFTYNIKLLFIEENFSDMSLTLSTFSSYTHSKNESLIKVTELHRSSQNL